MYSLLYVDDMSIGSCDRFQIIKLKNQLSSKFELKDLECAKKILGMKIRKDREKGRIFISQEGYCEKAFKLFNIVNAKLPTTPIASHFKLSTSDSSTNEEKKQMKMVPYASTMGSLMYIMICIRPNIAFGASLVNR